MADTVKLHNSTDIQVEVRSADGDGVMIMAKAKRDVDSKFNWNLPPGVVVFRPSHTVFGKKTKEVATVKALEEQSADLETTRKTLTSGATPAPNAPIRKAN